MYLITAELWQISKVFQGKFLNHSEKYIPTNKKVGEE